LSTRGMQIRLGVIWRSKSMPIKFLRFLTPFRQKNFPGSAAFWKTGALSWIGSGLFCSHYERSR
jgi:hypothetical protein